MSILIGVAIAQDSNQPQTTDTRQETNTKGTHQAQAGNTGMPEMKTQGYKGTLVDATCASPATTPATGAASTSTETGKPGKHENEASRTEGADQTCPVSANTTRFALKLDDGRTVMFDEVGNERAQEAIKTKKKWSDALSSKRPIHTKVSAVMTGDRLTVLSID